MYGKPWQAGFSLIEVLAFIIIVGIASSAMLSVMSSMSRNAATLLPEQQAQAIASALMQEILAQPFTFCDPDDPTAPTAANAAGCAVQETAMTPEAGEMRGGALPFDNTNDYHNYTANPVVLPDGTPVPGYRAAVRVAAAGALAGIPAADRLLVTVTVTPPAGRAIQLQGLRVRYAPNT
ncbi:MAG: type II secretion system protein [Thiobacillus sp.]